MAEEMFNADQRGHMRYLDSLEPEAVCACGWERIEDCRRGPNCAGALQKRQREAMRYRIWSASDHQQRVEWAAMDKEKRDAALDAEYTNARADSTSVTK